MGIGPSKRFLPLILLLAIGLSSCSSEWILSSLVPADQAKAAKTYLEDIRTGAFAPVQAAIAPEYKAQLNLNLLQQMQALFGRDAVKSLKVVGSQSSATSDFKRYAITYEYELGPRWVLAQIILWEADGRREIAGIRVQKLTQSLERANAFTLSNKNPLALIFLALMVIVPIFIVYTEIVCWRTPIQGRKWLWRIFVLFGLTGFYLNWTTGDAQFLPVNFQLLGAAFSKQPFGPTMLQLGIPVGALLFWLRRRSWLKQANPETQDTPAAS